MSTLPERIVQLLSQNAGLTDREITDRLFDASTGQQGVNQAARRMEIRGSIRRERRADGKIGNYLCSADDALAATIQPPSVEREADGLQEGEVKQWLKEWLEAAGWQVDVKWGHDRGTDIEARRGEQIWLIEVKGCGSRQPMRGNYFLGVLGETLQRMEFESARYSIALPDMQQYRGLWERLPRLAKSRTKITALFVTESGAVNEVG